MLGARAVIGLALLSLSLGASRAAETWPGEHLDTWHGYVRHNFTVDGCPAWVVEPKQASPGLPWDWYMEFPDAFTYGPNEFKFAPIIRRNTPLPASRSELFCTVSDNQPRVEVDVYQGDSGDIRRNHRVGKLYERFLA